MPPEKRRFVRVESHPPVVYRVEGGNGPMRTMVAGNLQSVSVGGALIEVPDEIALGSILRIEIPIPSMLEGISATARALRCQPGSDPGRYLVAAEFIQLGPDDEETIARYIDDILSTAQQTYESLVSKLDLLQEFSRDGRPPGETQLLMERTMDTALLLADADSGAILLYNPENERLEFAVARGPKAHMIREFTLALGEGIAGWVALHRRPLNVFNPEQEERWRADIAEAIEYRTTNLLAVPILLGAQALGVIEVINKRTAERFTLSDIRTLQTLAIQAGLMMENLQVREQARRAREEAEWYRRAALGNISHATVVAPSDIADLLCNKAAKELLFTEEAEASGLAEGVRILMNDVRLVAPVAIQDAGVHTLRPAHELPGGRPPFQLLAHVNLLEDARGEKRGAIGYFLPITFEHVGPEKTSEEGRAE